MFFCVSSTSKYFIYFSLFEGRYDTILKTTKHKGANHMKTIAAHPMFSYDQKEREERTFWLSVKKYLKLMKHNDSLGNYDKKHVQTVTTKNGHIQLTVKKGSALRELDENPYIKCDCGFKGEGIIKEVEKIKKGNMIKTFKPACSECGRDEFDIEFSYQYTDLSYVEIFHNENKLSLSFSFQQYEVKSYQKDKETDDLTMKSYPLSTRLTYDYKKKVMYWVMPRKKIVRNISYGSVHDLQIHILNQLMEFDEGKKKYHQFMYLCLKKAGIHPKKTKQALERVKYGYQFSKDHLAGCKVIFPLLTIPQLSAIDNESFIVSIATAPKSIKDKIKKSKGTMKDIIHNLYGFSNKRLLRYLALDENSVFNLDLLRPLFKNDTFLLDVLYVMNGQLHYAWNRSYETGTDFPRTRMFLAVKNLRKTVLPKLKNIKKRFKDELSFRNELINVLKSHHCQGDLTRLLRLLDDIDNLKYQLLRIMPEEKLPNRFSIVALHDAYVKEINKNEEVFKALDLKENGFGYSEKEKELEEMKDGYVIRLAESPNDLAYIGKELSNCVRGYTNAVRKRNSLVMVLEKQHVPLVCIELKVRTDGFSLEQASGYGNSLMSNKQVSRIAEWIKKHKIRDVHNLTNRKYSEEMEEDIAKAEEQRMRRIQQHEVIAQRERIMERREPVYQPVRYQTLQGRENVFGGTEITDVDLPF